MFVTHPSFKLAVQFDGDAVNWRSIEVAIRATLFLVTTKEPKEAVTRDFFLGCEPDLVQFLEKQPAGRTVSVSLVQSPGFSSTGGWQIVPIQRVDRKLGDGSRYQQLVLTDFSGKRYSGFPAEAIASSPGPLECMAEFA